MRGLKYISWADKTGYAVAARSYMYGLLQAGINLSWTPMLYGRRAYVPRYQSHWPWPELKSICHKAIDYDTVLIHTVPEYYPYWLNKLRQPGVRILGYTVWEGEELPAHWPDILNQLDGVIVPCDWNLGVFKGSGVKVPVYVVPHISQFKPGLQANHGALHARMAKAGVSAAGRQVFYNIAFWSNRKAPFLAIEAYLRAFTALDNTLLVIKTSRYDVTRWYRSWRYLYRRRHPSPLQAFNELVQSLDSDAPVLLICDEDLEDAEILALHEIGDCFVSLTHTEGWGLGAFEAARRGNPVVMTGYGGQRDFLSPANSWLLDWQMVPMHEPAWASYLSTGFWAEPDMQQAIRYLRTIHANPELARRCARPQAERIAREFATAPTIDKLLHALELR